MNSPNIGTDWSPENHPPLELLRQYQTGMLLPEAEHQVERHLLSCELCTDVAEGMELSSPALTPLAVTDLHHRVKQRLAEKKKKAAPLIWLDWRAAAAVLVLIFSLGLVIYQQFEQHQNSDSTLATTAPPVLKPAETTVEAIAPAPPVASEEAMEEKFAPTEPPVAYQKPVEKFTSPVIQAKVAEEIPDIEAENDFTVQPDALADGDVLDSKEGLAAIPSTAAAPPPPKALSHPLPDSVWKAEQAIAAQRLKAEEDRLALMRSRSAPKAKMMIRGSAPLPKTVAAASVSTTPLVKGKVVSSDGEGLPGVSVVVKGTTQAVATDAEGNFQLPLEDSKATLSFSYIGFEAKEVEVNAQQKPLKVELQADARSLSEVVVVGYGTQNKSSVQAETVVTAPKPVNGMAAFKKYVKKNLRYPDNAQNLRGRVVVQFTVSEKGEIVNPQVVKSFGPAFDAEALRLVQEGPTWKPGTRNGRPVAQTVKVTVRFKKD